MSLDLNFWIFCPNVFVQWRRFLFCLRAKPFVTLFIFKHFISLIYPPLWLDPYDSHANILKDSECERKVEFYAERMNAEDKGMGSTLKQTDGSCRKPQQEPVQPVRVWTYNPANLPKLDNRSEKICWDVSKNGVRAPTILCWEDHEGNQTVNQSHQNSKGLEDQELISPKTLKGLRLTL